MYALSTLLYRLLHAAFQKGAKCEIQNINIAANDSMQCKDLVEA